MEVRPVRDSDWPEVEAVIASAFGEQADGRTVRMVRALRETGACRVGLVARDDEVVGYVQLSRAWIDARRRLVDALMLTPLVVAPAHQRHGIATRLLSAALEAAVETDAVAVLLEGDPGFYGPRGFSAGESCGLRRPSDRIPERSFQVAALPRYEGWMTGRVVLPEAMWTTDTVGLRDPLLEEIEDSTGR